MNALSASDPVQILVPFLLGAVCGGPFLMFYVVRLWLEVKRPQSQRIARVEYKLNRIARHLGVDDLGDSNPILRELWKGNKINAIKIYKEQTGVGLKEAKDAVDALERGDFAALEHSDATA